MEEKTLDVALRDLDFSYSAPLTSKDGNILSCLELFCVDGCTSPHVPFKILSGLCFWGGPHMILIIMGSPSSPTPRFHHYGICCVSMDSGSSLLPHYRGQHSFSFSSPFSMSYFLLSFLFPVGSTHLGFAQKQSVSSIYHESGCLGPINVIMWSF